MNAHIIDILSSLGERLVALPDAVVDLAVAANPWFTPADIRRAAGALAGDMLSRRALSEWLVLYGDGSPRAASAVELASPPVLRCILIVMAGNIPFVGLQDLVCVLAAGCRALVKPSSKDAVLMSWVVEQLLDIDPRLPVSFVPLVSNTAADNPDASDTDFFRRPNAVVAMGGDEAVAAIRAKYADIPALLRGNRSSAAILDGGESPEELAALADDVLSYSGLGCRNVSLIFVPRDYDFARLQNAMSERVPALNPKHRNNYLQNRAMLKMNDTPHLDAESCLLRCEQDFSKSISILNYAFYSSLSEVMDWLCIHDSETQCIATNIPLPLDRTVALGRTQHPTLFDYPDGRDTMEFLAGVRSSEGKSQRLPPATKGLQKKKTLIVVVGPTGSGKTDLSIELATRLSAPIVSADSRQVYRGMKIGSAQPSDEQLNAVPHYFIADRGPEERFTCADFEREASALLETLFESGDHVVAVGGSGLYIDALTGGLDAIPEVDMTIREELNSRFLQNGLQPLLEELAALDPLYFATVDRHNRARVIRALEVCRQTGKPFSSFRSASSLHDASLRNVSPGDGRKAARSFDIIKIGVDLPRPELYERIDRRVDAMMEAGLEAEARGLYHLRHLPALQTVGYRELFAHFDGEYPLSRAVELIKRNSRRYAKRQMTWFRRDTNILWFHTTEIQLIIEHILN